MSMGRTDIDIDIDDKAYAELMQWHGFTTKGEAGNLALRALAVEHAPPEEAHASRGSG